MILSCPTQESVNDFPNLQNTLMNLAESLATYSKCWWDCNAPSTFSFVWRKRKSVPQTFEFLSFLFLSEEMLSKIVKERNLLLIWWFENIFFLLLQKCFPQCFFIMSAVFLLQICFTTPLPTWRARRIAQCRSLVLTWGCSSWRDSALAPHVRQLVPQPPHRTDGLPATRRSVQIPSYQLCISLIMRPNT